MGSLAAGANAAPSPGPQNDGPQSANIPYVAWVGEHVRLVACDPSIDVGLQYANYAVEDWSGYQFQPPTPDGDAGNNLGQIFDPGPSAFFTSSEPAHNNDDDQEGCVATDYKSLNPGLSRIRLVVRDQDTDAIVFSHQFLVIWLTANKPTLSEASLSGSGSETFESQTGGLSSYLGDPAGDGSFVPSPFDSGTATNADRGLIQVRVTGSFPVVAESPLSNVLPNSSYTLPTDWATLAGILASASNETEPPGSNPSLWDIHGTPREATTPNAGSATNDPLHDVFFRPAFNDYTSGETATVGPFDPEAAEETLLSDGRLNEDDAPMPAMRIDVRLAKNEGSGIGGVGQISGASKAQLYSHNFNGNAEEANNLYNPYYGEYIPATDRPVNEASGITGSSPGGDFPGFLNTHPQPYTFWESVLSGEYREGHPTGCLRRAPGKSTDATSEDDYFTPNGYSRETFYTDERGEAYVTYTPGDGFFFENLPTIHNNNGGCDLAPLYEQEIGNSSITAEAVYPYEPVDYPSLTSEALVKRVRSQWLKETYEFPKGPENDEADQNIRIIVAKAQDIDGYPMIGEEVCFNATADSALESFDGEVADTENLLKEGGGSVALGGSTVKDPSDEGSDHLCETTNGRGLAAVEVTNSTESKVDVVAHYINEGITRDHLFDFSTNAGSKQRAAEKAKEEEVKKEEEAKKAKEAEEANAKKRAAEEKEAEEAREKAKAEEKLKHEKELAETKSEQEKEALEKKVKEEEEAAEKAREEAKAAEKARHEREAKEENEKAAPVSTSSTTATTAATTTTPTLVTSVPGGLSTASSGAVPGGGVDAFAASKKVHKASKHKKKTKKHKKKHKKK
jgi:hypothetical protein